MSGQKTKTALMSLMNMKAALMHQTQYIDFYAYKGVTIDQYC